MSKVELSFDLSGFACSKDETSQTIVGASFSSGESSFPSTAGVSKLGISIAGTHVAGAQSLVSSCKTRTGFKDPFFQPLPLSDEETATGSYLSNVRGPVGAEKGLELGTCDSLTKVFTLFTPYFMPPFPLSLDASFNFRGPCALKSSPATVFSEIRVVS